MSGIKINLIQNLFLFMKIYFISVRQNTKNNIKYALQIKHRKKTTEIIKLNKDIRLNKYYFVLKSTVSKNFFRKNICNKCF